MIGIIDYGAGNLRSVKKAFDFLGFDSRIISNSDELENIDRVLLPGVGAFGAAVSRLTESGFKKSIKTWMEENRPFLGICLGMQMMLERSEETKESEGIGFIKGDNVKFVKGKVPQIGWNRVLCTIPNPLFEGIKDGSYFYFVHSYYVKLEDDSTIAESEYGQKYPSVLNRGRVYGVQFHPEKSGENGLKMLHNWVTKC